VIFEGFETADGQVIVAAANDRLFAKLCNELGRPEWINDPRYKTNAARIANKATLIGAVADILRQKTCAEWVERLEKVGVPCAPINDMSVMKDHPQTKALDILQPVPELDLALISLPLAFDGARPRIKTRAPKLGQHNATLPGMPMPKG
jgi:crotonobetainyl-CoA:carnitine CoA-transferase CaiB-like acyl-CoA transferase